MEQRYWNEYKDTQYDEYTDDGLFLYNFQIMPVHPQTGLLYRQSIN